MTEALLNLESSATWLWTTGQTCTGGLPYLNVFSQKAPSESLSRLRLISGMT